MNVNEIRAHVRSLLDASHTAEDIDDALRATLDFKPKGGENGWQCQAGLYRDILYHAATYYVPMSDWAKVTLMDILLKSKADSISIPRRLFANR